MGLSISRTCHACCASTLTPDCWQVSKPLQVIREKKMMKQDLGDILGMMFGGECHSRVHGMARAWRMP